MIVCDTGPLVALSNERDEHYVTANNFFRDLHMAGETLMLPSMVLVSRDRQEATCLTVRRSADAVGHDLPVAAAAMMCAASHSASCLTNPRSAEPRVCCHGSPMNVRPGTVVMPRSCWMPLSVISPV